MCEPRGQFAVPVLDRLPFNAVSLPVLSGHLNDLVSSAFIIVLPLPTGISDI